MAGASQGIIGPGPFEELGPSSPCQPASLHAKVHFGAVGQSESTRRLLLTYSLPTYVQGFGSNSKS